MEKNISAITARTQKIQPFHVVSILRYVQFKTLFPKHAMSESDSHLDALHQQSAHVQLESPLVPQWVLRDLLLHLQVRGHVSLRDAPG